MSETEIEQLLAYFKRPGINFAAGVSVNGIQYVGTKGDTRHFYGKSDAGGVVCAKTLHSKNFHIQISVITYDS